MKVGSFLKIKYKTEFLILTLTIIWAFALIYSSISGRVMYGDGAWFLLQLLSSPHRFFDYDSQRTFSSLISQAPVLLGQRFGVSDVTSYAALYSFGVFAIPAIIMMIATYLSRNLRLLFSLNLLAVVVYGFGVNYINSEVNLFFSLTFLILTILGLDLERPVLRGFFLPLASFCLLKSYEGMLLVGPLLSAWAIFASMKTKNSIEQAGLVLSSFILFIGAVEGLGGFLSPRDLSNANNFLSSAFSYLHSPQLFLFVSAIFALLAVYIKCYRIRRLISIVSLFFGLFFLFKICRLDGLYSYSVYYTNRSFLVLLMPVLVAIFLAIFIFRKSWLSQSKDISLYVMLIPLIMAVLGDFIGTYQWNIYAKSFCNVLYKELTPLERFSILQKSGLKTSWIWTNPTLSLLFRDRGSNALVLNDPVSNTWEPFDPNVNIFHHNYKGFCQTSSFFSVSEINLRTPILFSSSEYPAYVKNIKGLSYPEDWATWSDGSYVEINLEQSLPSSFDLVFNIAGAYGQNKYLPIKVQVGNKKELFIFNNLSNSAILKFRNTGVNRQILISIPQPESPFSLSDGNDRRKLGIALKSIAIIPW
jgi:hypothetical protein